MEPILCNQRISQIIVVWPAIISNTSLESTIICRTCPEVPIHKCIGIT